jgi:hypothetical protein
LERSFEAVRSLRRNSGLSRNFGLAGPILDHADEQVGFTVRTADLKAPDRNGPPPPDGVIDGIDDYLELLLSLQQLPVPFLDQFGGRSGKQLSAFFP